MRRLQSDQDICVVYMATLFLTVFRSKPPGDEQISTRGRSSRLFWKARFLASSLKLIRSKVWACFSSSEAHLHLREVTCVRPFSSSHFSAVLLGTCFKSICGQAPIGSLKRIKLLIKLEQGKSRLTVDNFLLGLVDLLPHLPEYLLLHHLQVPRASVPVHHRMCFWGILGS